MSRPVDDAGRLVVSIEGGEMTGWRASARCRGMNLTVFYPEVGDDTGLARAKAICGDCPVRAECREAGRHEPLGVWGGVSERSRRRDRNRPAKRCPVCGDACAPCSILGTCRRETCQRLYKAVEARQTVNV